VCGDYYSFIEDISDICGNNMILNESSKSILKKSLKIPKVQPEAVILRRTKYNDQMEKGTNKSNSFRIILFPHISDMSSRGTQDS
jgi:hypothetical protein